MAMYTAQIVSSNCRSYTVGGSSSDNIFEVRSDNIFEVVTAFKFNQSSISQYKKKRIGAISIFSPYCNVRTYTENQKEIRRGGGSISALKSPYSSGTSAPMENVVLAYAYQEGYGRDSQKVTLQIPYFLKDAPEILGGKAYRDFYEQLAVGFVWANYVPATEKKQLGFYDPDSDSYVGMEIQFWDFTDISPSFPISGAYIDPTIINNFVVGYEAFDSIDYPTVTSATVEIKDVATSVVTTVSPTMSINLKGRLSVPLPIPENTVSKNKNYQWRAKLITDDGETDYTDWADFTTSDAVPSAPIINSPQSSYLDAASPITLSWTHNINTGSTQHAYDIDYRQSGDWTNFSNHVISSEQTATIPANTLESGSFIWRARTYNTDDIPGPYAESSTNVVQAKPTIPVIISVSSAPRTEIVWQSSGQQAYELYIGDRRIYNFGIGKSYQIDDYLPDGIYAIKLRIQNAQGLWSDYAQTSVQIQNVPLIAEDILLGVPVPGGVRLIISLPPVYKTAKYVNEGYVNEIYTEHSPSAGSGIGYILRDGEPIVQITGGEYIDYASAGNHSYVYRITDNGYYYDTPEIVVAPIIKYGIMSAADNPLDFIPLTYRVGSKPQPQKQFSKGYNAHYFSGRAQPVYDITEHYEVSWQLEYAIRKDNCNKLKSWAYSGKSILIRYNDGEKIRGIIQSLTKIKETRETITISFTVIEHDYSEAVNYV